MIWECKDLVICNKRGNAVSRWCNLELSELLISFNYARLLLLPDWRPSIRFHRVTAQSRLFVECIPSQVEILFRLLLHQCVLPDWHVCCRIRQRDYILADCRRPLDEWYPIDSAIFSQKPLRWRGFPPHPEILTPRDTRNISSHNRSFYDCVSRSYSHLLPSLGKKREWGPVSVVF